LYWLYPGEGSQGPLAQAAAVVGNLGTLRGVAVVVSKVLWETILEKIDVSLEYQSALL
jgi:hypothetical protein